MKRYLEGYHCQDVSEYECALEAIRTPKQRDVLNLLRDSYPNTLTIQEIAKIKVMDESTVGSIVQKLLRHGFILKGKKTKPPGKPRTGTVTGKKPAELYSFEDLTFISNKEKNFRFQFAPGSVKYNGDFLEMYNQITDGLNQNRIFPLLVKFLEDTFVEINHSSSKRIRSMAPEAGTKFICSACGFNHEMRDFVRAMLLRMLDQLEINNRYIRFLQDRECISSDRYDHLQKLSQELETKELSTKAKNITTLRVLSIRHVEHDTSLFLGINQDSKFVCGVIDSILVRRHAIELDTIIQCEPTVMDDAQYDKKRPIRLSSGQMVWGPYPHNNTPDIYYIKIFQEDYLKKIIDDPTFPTFSKVRSNIEKIRETASYSSTDLFVVDAVVVEDRDNNLPKIEERHIGKKIVQYIDTIIGDGFADHGKIRLVGRYDSAKDLRDGDRIKVVGACAIPLYDDVHFDFEPPVVVGIELRLSPYGLIMRGEGLTSNVIDTIKTEEIVQTVHLKDDENTSPSQGRILAKVERSKSRICIFPEIPVASALDFGFKSLLVSRLAKIKRVSYFELFSNQIQETEIFEYEISEANNGLLTSIVILNYGDKKRLDEILKHVKRTLARAINEKEFGPTYDVKMSS